MPRARPATPQEIGDGEDRRVDVLAPEVPAGVRAAVLEMMQAGDVLWRCPRLSGRQGLFGFGKRSVIIEWWLLDAQGELVEAFWEDA